MEKSSEKRHLPDSDPRWNLELPDGYTNSLVTKNGKAWNNGHNFDEKDDEFTKDNEFEELLRDRELAEYAKNRIIYTGLFVNPDELYSNFPPRLAHKIRDPHVTVTFHPGIDKVFLDSLGSKAVIHAVGYGNNGENEGLLVEVSAEDPAIQKTIEEHNELDDKTGELKKFPTHITLSIAEGAKAVNTKNLDFVPFDNPIDFAGSFMLFGKDGNLIQDKETVLRMQESDSSVQEVDDPDRM